ncbi:urease accessory protein UreD [Antrihabitans sp. YC3-6]|uniref:Urease accessory protein UreD n=1 Tax=Antrihabitans stalagmiti TaxID=2799499 RepID=A0A934U168_9NOCA|nr:urease accessory protein UreD [Antrihabitans stalagmiti]MBJ8337966.1 urease accessory protein UreD [Antrihabitans stalagmiti]
MYSELLIVAERGRLPQISGFGAITARITDPETVHLIGAAATPLGGDRIDVTVRVCAGARLRVRSVAAAIALPGSSQLTSSARLTLVVADDAFLDVDQEPMIIAGGADHRAKTVVRLAASATIRVRERVQLGRTGETNGRWQGALDADLDNGPLLRHCVELGATTASTDVIDAPQAAVGELRYPDSRPAELFGLSAARLPLAAGGSLLTWLGARLPADLATVER